MSKFEVCFPYAALLRVKDETHKEMPHNSAIVQFLSFSYNIIIEFMSK